MARLRFLPFTALLVACQQGQLAQSCPTPVTSPSGMLVTQVLLRMGEPGGPQYSVSLTASGDALYVGAPTLPVPGAYMGRLNGSAFQRIANDLMARGLPGDSAGMAHLSCAPEPEISVALQTADGRYSGTAFCGHSAEETRFAAPIYSAIEQIRWYPGARVITLKPN
ncbi:MAG TPA: hypothetical protein VLD58_01395 [Gemmatimonadales bacterium]|nr:hypothetical protein [Gemmatimonadales bacterium]